MARKDIIQDFGCLKGKMIFSEKAHVSEAAHEVKKERPASPGKSESLLKVGQKVVLMDSDLRGKITSIGRSVGIELEDGLVIKAAYGEFALTDDDEISALKESRIKMKKCVTPVKASPAVSPTGMLSVDLHIEAIPGGRNIPKGQQLAFQMEMFRKVIHQNLSHKGRRICFIHGIGDGILKAAIRKELDEVLALRCSYSVGDPAVTIVSIK